jgi:hypothetical protein
MSNEFFKTPNQEIDETGAWLSIGDLMSGLLMIFSLLLIVALLQLTEAAEESKESRIIIIQSLQKTLAEEGINAKINPEAKSGFPMKSCMLLLKGIQVHQEAMKVICSSA